MATPAETAPSDRKRHALELFSGLPAAYDRMGAALSFGQDPRWRHALVGTIGPHPGQRVLDVATGTGMVAFALARNGAEVTGLDQSEDMLAGARRRATEHPDLAGRLTFIQGEAERLPFPDQTFDALSFTYLLRYVDDPAATMRELARVVKPGGRIGMVEFGVPESPPLKALWRVYTRVGLPTLGRAGFPGVAGRRPLPRPEHRAVSRGRARPGRALARRRDRASPDARDELRGRHRHERRQGRQK